MPLRPFATWMPGGLIEQIRRADDFYMRAQTFDIPYERAQQILKEEMDKARASPDYGAIEAVERAKRRLVS